VAGTSTYWSWYLRIGLYTINIMSVKGWRTSVLSRPKCCEGPVRMANRKVMRGNWTSVGKHVFREANAPILPTP